jgi:hypothetical protein
MHPLKKGIIVLAYAQHKRKNSKFEKALSKYADHARKELMRVLSVRVRN